MNADGPGQVSRPISDHWLASQKIEVINNTKITEIQPEAVVLSDGGTIPTRTTIWAAGVEPGPLVKSLDVLKDARERILVDEFLRVKDRPEVYAVGDCVSIEGRPRLPAFAQSAEQEGEVAGWIEKKAAWGCCARRSSARGNEGS